MATIPIVEFYDEDKLKGLITDDEARALLKSMQDAPDEDGEDLDVLMKRWDECGEV